MAQGAVRFYHLTRSAPDHAIRALSEKCLAQGWQVLVTCQDEAVLTKLDDALWLGPEDRFLPHGMAGGAHDARQPVLLSPEAPVHSTRAAVMALLPAAVTPMDARNRERLFVLFDGAREDHVQLARQLWRDTQASGLAAEYYSEASGRWALERKLEA